MTREEMIAQRRAWMFWSDTDSRPTDQQLKKPQPPLVKAPSGGPVTPLGKDFESLGLKRDLVRVLYGRRSRRVYTQEPLSLAALSFLCWAQQGVRGIRGRKYATLRTVPSGGARHAFEMYVTALRAEGLAPGHYRYMPMEHALELVRPFGDGEEGAVAEAVCGQTWALKASVIFWYSAVPYRAEWRYAEDAHRVMLIDAGHVTENLYVACSALGLGTCAIAAVDAPRADALLGLDGKEESAFYCAPVGSVSPEGEEAEQEFYAFLKDSDL